MQKGWELSGSSQQNDFVTFCWGEIIEELRNTYKPKELINVPVSVPNNV